MNKVQNDVKEFMEGTEQTFPIKPTPLDERTARLRMRLILEETQELAIALGFENSNLENSLDNIIFDQSKCNLVEVADSLADITYVTIGAAIATGINLKPVWDEVQRSNMSKLPDGYKREDGKFMKGSLYSPANLEPIIVAQMAESPQPMLPGLDV